MLDKRTVREVAERFAEKAKEMLNPDAILLFGSYVDGTPREHSDIDIAVICNGFDGNWYEAMVNLCGLAWDFAGFCIEPHLLDKSRDKTGFVEHVLKTGEFLYKAA